MVRETSSAAKEVVLAVPPATYTVTHHFFGVTWAEWSAAAIFFYTLMQMARLYPKTQRCILCFIRHKWTCNGSCKELR